MTPPHALPSDPNISAVVPIRPVTPMDELTRKVDQLAEDVGVEGRVTKDVQAAYGKVVIALEAQATATAQHSTAIDNLAEKHAALAASFSTFRGEVNGGLADIEAAIIRRDAGDAERARADAKADKARDQRIAAMKGGAGGGVATLIAYVLYELLKLLFG